MCVNRIIHNLSIPTISYYTKNYYLKHDIVQFQRIYKRYIKCSKDQIFETWAGRLKYDTSRKRQSQTLGTQTPREWVTCGQSESGVGSEAIKTLKSIPPNSSQVETVKSFRGSCFKTFFTVHSCKKLDLIKNKNSSINFLYLISKYIYIFQM